MYVGGILLNYMIRAPPTTDVLQDVEIPFIGIGGGWSSGSIDLLALLEEDGVETLWVLFEDGRAAARLLLLESYGGATAVETIFLFVETILQILSQSALRPDFVAFLKFVSVAFSDVLYKTSNFDCASTVHVSWVSFKANGCFHSILFYQSVLMDSP